MARKAQEPRAMGAIQVLAAQELIQHLDEPASELHLGVFEVAVTKKVSYARCGGQAELDATAEVSVAQPR